MVLVGLIEADKGKGREPGNPGAKGNAEVKNATNRFEGGWKRRLTISPSIAALG